MDYISRTAYIPIANQVSSNISVLLGNGVGNFGAATNFGGVKLSSATAENFN